MELTRELPRSTPVLPSWLTATLAAWRSRRARRREIAAIRAFGASALRDIGIDPSEVSSLVNTSSKGRKLTYRPDSQA